MKDVFDNFYIVDEVHNKLDKNKYPKGQLKTKDVEQAENLQVRMIKSANKQRVKNIVDRFDPDLCDPIIVITNDDNHPLYLIDGNHRLAAHKAMKKEFIEAIQIQEIEFYNSKAAILKFGHRMNVDVIDKQECSNIDIKALIAADWDEGTDIRTEEYLQDLSNLYKKNPTSIGRLRQAVLQSGLKSRKRPLTVDEVSERVQKFKKLNPEYATYQTISRVCHEQGLGAILNQMNKQNKDKGILFVYHSRLDHEESHSDKLEIVRNIADEYNLNIEVEDLGFEMKSEYN